MSSKALFRTLLLLLPLASLAACTGMRGPDVAIADPSVPAETIETAEPTGTVEGEVTESTDPTDTSAVVEPLAPPPPPSNPAVVALLDSAHAEANAGRLPTATAAIERALRIEPRNPLLWQELAMLKLQKGEYRLAENFAARSNSWAGSNKPLLAKNWRIIGEARSLQGNNDGAKAAFARANAFEPPAVDGAITDPVAE